MAHLSSRHDLLSLWLKETAFRHAGFWQEYEEDNQLRKAAYFVATRRICLCQVLETVTSQLSSTCYTVWGTMMAASCSVIHESRFDVRSNQRSSASTWKQNWSTVTCLPGALSGGVFCQWISRWIVCWNVLRPTLQRLEFTWRTDNSGTFSFWAGACYLHQPGRGIVKSRLCSTCTLLSHQSRDYHSADKICLGYVGRIEVWVASQGMRMSDELVKYFTT